MASKNDIYNTLISNGVPESQARILMAVANPESHYNPKAEAIGAKEDSVGIFQINMYAHGDKLKSATGSDNISDWRTWLQNPINNAILAAQVYKSGGLKPWTGYTSGAYLSYLNKDDLTSTAPIKGTETNNSSTPVSSTGALDTVTANSSSTSLFTRISYIVIGITTCILGVIIFLKTLPTGGNTDG